MAEQPSNYVKYQTKNPLMQRIIRRFLERVVGHVEALRPARVIDLGCGEGMVARELLALPFPIEYRGLELNPEAVAIARRELPEVDITQADILETEPEVGWADLAICLEVLEHLPEPERAVRRIAAWTRSAALISVPWEPYFRTGNLLRGKYLPTWGNHPEHIQQFGPESFRRLLEESFGVVRVDTCFPWLIALAAAPRRS